jgi:pullulanase/glycogen debranching enzyme
VLVNAYWKRLTFALPTPERGHTWRLVLDTAGYKPETSLVTSSFEVTGRALAVFVHARDGAEV